MTFNKCQKCIIDFKQDVINMLIQTIEKKDTYTSGHAKRVAKYSVLIANELHLVQKDIEILYQSALMHDIGKIVISSTILQKKEKLTSSEYGKIKEHSLIGWEMLNEIKLFKCHANIIRHHHENYDGTGYPFNLIKEDIPLLSRIISIADSYDAMTSLRDYQQNFSKYEALSELERCSGTQFDPLLIPKAIKVFEKLS